MWMFQFFLQPTVHKKRSVMETKTIPDARILSDAGMYNSVETTPQLADEVGIVFQPDFKSAIVKLKSNTVM